MIKFFVSCIAFCLVVNPLSALITGQLSHSEGKGLGFRNGYTTLGLRWQEFNPTLTPFVDVKAHVFNNGKPASNVGVGFRYRNVNNIFGGNFYYDYRQGHRKGFNQLGIGIEMLGLTWDVRCNGYIVVGIQKQKVRTEFFRYPGGFFADYKERQFAASGVDGEVGYHFWNRDPCNHFNLYAAAGPYYFKTSSPHNAIGGKVRLVANVGNYFSAELRTTYDRVFHGRVQGLLTVRYPFGCLPEGNFCGFEAIATQPVYRNDMIVLDRGYRWRANF